MSSGYRPFWRCCQFCHLWPLGGLLEAAFLALLDGRQGQHLQIAPEGNRRVFAALLPFRVYDSWPWRSTCDSVITMDWARTLKRVVMPHVRKVAYRLALSAALARRRRSSCVLMYHGVAPVEAETFQEQMQFLARNFSVVSLDRLVGTGTDGHPAQGSVALTFDDGLRNNYTVVYPILRRLGLPATYFVCPGLVASGRWLWTHEARARLARLSPAAIREGLAGIGAPGVEADSVVEWMKSLPLVMRRRAEDAIRKATPTFTPSAAEHERFDVMIWSELEALDQGLITIGSHSMSHAMLPGLSAGELEFEVWESRRVLERHLDREVRYFCYPNGRRTAGVLEQVRRCYSAALLADCGMVRPECDPHLVPRIPGAPEDPALLAWRMHRPEA